MWLSVFRQAGAAGRVFTVTRQGTYKDRGLGWSGVVTPFTTIAVVPTNQQPIPLIVDARTSDQQSVTVSGTLQLTLDPAKALKAFDFTVNAGNWQRDLQTIVSEALRSTVMSAVSTNTVQQAVTAHSEIETAVLEAKAKLAEFGVTLVSCSIATIEPEDEDVTDAIGAQQREQLLAGADKARHDRQMESEKQARAIKETQAATALKLEKERAKLIAEQGKNKKTEAEHDAEATRIRLEPLNEHETSNVMAQAFYEAAKSGRLTSVTLTPELLATLQQASRPRG